MEDDSFAAKAMKFKLPFTLADLLLTPLVKLIAADK